MQKYIYALFDNETAEPVSIKLLSSSVGKLFEVYTHEFQSPMVQESAKRSIECAYEVIFSDAIGKYFQAAPINVTARDLEKQVDGCSAGLAYAIAFAVALGDKNIIDIPLPLFTKIAATGETDNQGNVTKINNLKQKIMAAIKENVNIMFFPSQNYGELKLLRKEYPEFDTLINSSGILLKHIPSIKDAFCELGILPKTCFLLKNASKTGQSEASFHIELNNESRKEISSIEFSIKYDPSVLTPKYIIPGKLIKYRKQFEQTAIIQGNRILIHINSTDEMIYTIKSSGCLAEIGFEAVGSIENHSVGMMGFDEEKCFINSIPCLDMGGIHFESNGITASAKEILQNSLVENRLNKESVYPKHSKITPKMVALIGITLILMSSIYYVLSTVKPFGNRPAPTIQALAENETAENTPDLSNTTPECTTPSYTTPESTIPSYTTPTITSLNITTPIGNTPTAGFTPAITAISTPEAVNTMTSNNKAVYSTPVTKKAAFQVDVATNTGIWTANGPDIIVEPDKDNGGRSAVKIKCDITSKGDILIFTKPNSLQLSSKGYSKLKFNYLFSSGKEKIYSVGLRINPEENILVPYPIQPLNSTWNKAEINIMNISEIKSLEFFVGYLSNDIDETDTISLSLSNFTME